MKEKVCKNSECKKKFTPCRQMQTTCDFLCAIAYTNQRAEKKAKAEKKVHLKEKKEFYKKDVTTQKMKAQNAFNRYIRTRDAGNDCISCGCKVEKGDSSHFYAVGSCSGVRFHTDNAHLSCYKCNRFLHGNLIPYKVALIEKIGQERFNRLEKLSSVTKSYNSHYYDRIIKIFNAKTKKLSL